MAFARRSNSQSNEGPTMPTCETLVKTAKVSCSKKSGFAKADCRRAGMYLLCRSMKSNFQCRHTNLLCIWFRCFLSLFIHLCIYFGGSTGRAEPFNFLSITPHHCTMALRFMDTLVITIDLLRNMRYNKFTWKQFLAITVDVLQK